MASLIKIGIDPKKRFGVSAKPGEITFGTHSHLLHYTPPQGLKLRLLIAKKRIKTATNEVRKVQRNRSIRTMLATLNATKAARKLALTERMAFLLEFQRLKTLQERSKNEKTAKRYQQQANQVYRKIRRREAIMKDAMEIEEKLKVPLTKALSNKTELKTKKMQTKVTPPLNESEKKDIDLLLDTKSMYVKRRESLLKEIRRGNLSTAELIRKRMQLNDTELSLKDTNRLLRNMVNSSQKAKVKKN